MSPAKKSTMKPPSVHASSEAADSHIESLHADSVASHHSAAPTLERNRPSSQPASLEESSSAIQLPVHRRSSSNLSFQRPSSRRSSSHQAPSRRSSSHRPSPALLSFQAPSIQHPIPIRHSSISLTSPSIPTFTLPPSPPSLPPPPFTSHLPFTRTHYHRLTKLYVPAVERADRVRFHEGAESADMRLGFGSQVGHLVGRVWHAMGWRRRLEEWELAVVEEFMEVLEEEGVVVKEGWEWRDDEEGERWMKMEEEVESGDNVKGEGKGKAKAKGKSPASRGRKRKHADIHSDSLYTASQHQLFNDREPITAEDVANALFSLWVGRVQRGLMDLHEGEVGAWDTRLLRNRAGVLERRDAWVREQKSRGKQSVEDVNGKLKGKGWGWGLRLGR